MKHNFSVYTPFWDHVLGTYWPADDEKAQEKYRRGKENAARKAAKQLMENSDESATTVVKDREL